MRSPTATAALLVAAAAGALVLGACAGDPAPDPATTPTSTPTTSAVEVTPPSFEDDPEGAVAFALAESAAALDEAASVRVRRADGGGFEGDPLDGGVPPRALTVDSNGEADLTDGSSVLEVALTAWVEEEYVVPPGLEPLAPGFEPTSIRTAVDVVSIPTSDGTVAYALGDTAPWSGSWLQLDPEADGLAGSIHVDLADPREVRDALLEVAAADLTYDASATLLRGEVAIDLATVLLAAPLRGLVEDHAGTADLPTTLPVAVSVLDDGLMATFECSALLDALAAASPELAELADVSYLSGVGMTAADEVAITTPAPGEVVTDLG